MRPGHFFPSAPRLKVPLRHFQMTVGHFHVFEELAHELHRSTRHRR